MQIANMSSPLEKLSRSSALIIRVYAYIAPFACSEERRFGQVEVHIL